MINSLYKEVSIGAITNHKTLVKSELEAKLKEYEKAFKKYKNEKQQLLDRIAYLETEIERFKPKAHSLEELLELF